MSVGCKSCKWFNKINKEQSQGLSIKVKTKNIYLYCIYTQYTYSLIRAACGDDDTSFALFIYT